jgi:hypothetical protein
MQAASTSHSDIENSHIPNIGQGEAQLRKYKRIKLGGDQGHDR